MSQSLRIYLVRHGETEWSKSGQHTSRTDIPLTDQGESDAKALGARLNGVLFDRVNTSPARRARRTCELAGFANTAVVETDLAEWDYGDYEGRRTVDIRSSRPDWDLFRDGCPDGETPAQVSDRADRVIARWRTRDGTVAVFSHGHFIRALAARWVGLSVDSARRFLLGTSSLSILAYEHDKPTAPVVALWNSELTTIR